MQERTGAPCHLFQPKPHASTSVWLPKGAGARLGRVGLMAWYPAEADPQGGLDTADAIDASGALGANVSTTKAMTTCGAKSKKQKPTATTT